LTDGLPFELLGERRVVRAELRLEVLLAALLRDELRARGVDDRRAVEDRFRALLLV
jgi:hypothetical protein